MTPRKKEYLLFVCGYIRAHGWAPTVRELATGMGVSHTAAHQALRHLQGEGMLELGGAARAIQVTDLGWRMQA